MCQKINLEFLNKVIFQYFKSRENSRNLHIKISSTSKKRRKKFSNAHIAVEKFLSKKVT
jgi:hypothetical protein